MMSRANCCWPSFREAKIPTSGIARLKGHITTTKTRILAGMSHNSRQQVVRVDREPAPIEPATPMLAKLAQLAREHADASQALLVSDYGYGAATPQLVKGSKRTAGRRRKPITWTRAIGCWNIRA